MHLLTIPGAPAELLERINARRARIPAGLMMMADEAGATPAEAAPEGKPDEGDKPLGPGGEKALREEREARKALEKEVAALKGSTSILDALRKALTPDGDNPDPNVDLAKQVAELRRERDEAKADRERTKLAQDIAGEIGVADVRDVALIAAQQGEAAMRALAERLKGATPTPSVPKPDPSAGKTGDPKPRTLSEAIQQHYTS